MAFPEEFRNLLEIELKDVEDFAVYEARLPDGRVGYVEYDPARVQEVVSDHAKRSTS